ncbi:MAG: penicillin-binding protein activator [Rickettsiales bacterium]|jgi:ABC-type branched-subunit amino acid transport system substrate-binding protein|nr:penicillin-binding protein activator [Rickettsiales bacterium]
MIGFSKSFWKLLAFSLFALMVASCGDRHDLRDGKVTPERSETESEADEFISRMSSRRLGEGRDKLVVALLVPMSGPIKLVGESIINAAQLSLFENNKNNISLRFYDTKGTTFGAVEAINRAIEDGIDTVIGPLFKAETKAIQKIARKNKILLFSLSSEQDLLNSSNVFVTGSIVEQEIQTLISYLVTKGIYNYVGFMPNSSFGAAVNRVLRETVTNKDAMLIKTEYYDQDDQKMLQKISELVSFYEIPQTLYENYEKKKLEQKLLGITKNVDFSVTEEDKIYPQAMFIAEGGKFAEQIASLFFAIKRDRQDIQLIGTTKLDGDWNTLKNPYLNDTIFVGANPEKYEKFANSYHETYGSRPLKITSMVYDLVNIMDKVYEKRDGNTYVLSKAALLDPNGFDGIDGRFRFLPNGLIERRLYVLQFKDGEKVVLDTNQEFLNY